MSEAQQPATKQDFSDVRTDIDRTLESLREAIQDSETRILRALYGYTQTIDIRLAETKLVQDSIERRVSVIEMRLLDVEKRLNLPPAA